MGFGAITKLKQTTCSTTYVPKSILALSTLDGDRQKNPLCGIKCKKPHTSSSYIVPANDCADANDSDIVNDESSHYLCVADSDALEKLCLDDPLCTGWSHKTGKKVGILHTGVCGPSISGWKDGTDYIKSTLWDYYARDDATTGMTPLYSVQD